MEQGKGKGKTKNGYVECEEVPELFSQEELLRYWGPPQELLGASISDISQLKRQGKFFAMLL